MKKENWLLKEIDLWQEQEIVSKETADTLRTMYQPKKNISFLMVLFSIIGSLLIGMGIVLVSANNWWYSLPIALRTFIGFLPLLISQALIVFVYKYKMHSTAFRESAALLNMAGVFASIAIVDQVFHIPRDFTNYLLVCGLLFMPSMWVMNAISPLIVFYWTAINGGICFSDETGVIIALAMFVVGAVFALSKCKTKNGKSIYLSLITVISLFVLILVSAIISGCDLLFSVILYGYALLLLSASTLFRNCEDVFHAIGVSCFLILTFVLTYQWGWDYSVEYDSTVFLIITILMSLGAVALFVKNIMAKKYCVFSITTVVLFVLRAIWAIFDLIAEPFNIIFMVAFNVILFVLGILCIFEGVRNIDLYNANIGMITICILIIIRFFDSELPLSARGIVFLILGVGFLMFNLYLVKTRKKIKEGNL